MGAIFFFFLFRWKKWKKSPGNLFLFNLVFFFLEEKAKQATLTTRDSFPRQFLTQFLVRGFFSKEWKSISHSAPILFHFSEMEEFRGDQIFWMTWHIKKPYNFTDDILWVPSSFYMKQQARKRDIKWSDFTETAEIRHAKSI